MLGSPAASVRKLRIAVESARQFVGVEARRHFKRSAEPDDGARLSPAFQQAGMPSNIVIDLLRAVRGVIVAHYDIAEDRAGVVRVKATSKHILRRGAGPWKRLSSMPAFQARPGSSPSGGSDP
jgi:hypothetical protein